MPRKMPPKTGRGRYSQSDLERAAAEMDRGGLSLREVAPRYGMSASALSRHLKAYRESGQLVKRSIGAKAIFNPEMERALVEYIKTCAKMFHGLSLKQTRKVAYEYACNLQLKFPKSWDENKSASEDWLLTFREKHDDISLRTPESTSLARARGFNRASVNEFVDNVETIHDKYHLTPHQIWNLDETGVTTVQRPSQVLATKGTKQLGQTTSQERGSLVTLCCCINAAGESLPPAYVFPRVHFQAHMLKGGPPGSLGLATKSGWMTSELFVEVLKHFVKYMRVSKESPALVLLDNHCSHVSLTAINIARENGLVLVTFPPHCSHRLQPLDVSVYGPFKTYYNHAITNWLRDHPGLALTIYEIAELTKWALLKAATPENVQKGFQATGIHPLNRHIFSDDMFLAAESANPTRQTTPLSRDHSVASGAAAVMTPTSPLGSPSNSLVSQSAVSSHSTVSGDASHPRQGPSGLPSLPISSTPFSSKSKRPRVRSQILAMPTDSGSSSEEVGEPVLDDSSECSEPVSSDEEDYADGGDIKNGDFLVVSVPGKRRTQRFVCEVTDKDGDSLAVHFLKRSVKGNYFVKVSEQDEFEIEPSQIVFRLPPPKIVGGSARRERMVNFGGTENQFNVV